MTSNASATPQWIALYAITFVVIGALDGLWLGWLAKDLYRAEMGGLMAPSPRLVPAALFYIAYPLAIVYFGLNPAPRVSEAPLAAAFFRCAALGLVAYGTYNLTNMSVVRNFSIKLGLIDLAWGTLASGISGVAAWAVVRWWTLRG